MAKLDIRNEIVEPVTEIVFADREANAKFKLTSLSKGTNSHDLVRVNWDGDYAYVKHADIDNMIAALKKAKELWVR